MVLSGGGNFQKLGVEASVQGYEKFRSDLRGMGAAYDSTAQRFRDTSGRFASGGTQAADGAAEATAGISALGVATGAFVAGVAMKLLEWIGQAVTGLIRLGTESLTLAGRFDEMRLAALAIGQSMGQSREETEGFIDDLVEAGIRTDVAASTVAQFTRNQIDLSRAYELARVAQGSAILMDVDSSEAMSRLSRAISTNSTVTLRRMMIMTDLEAAEDRAAAATGRTTQEMSMQERMTARVNAIIDENTNLLTVYDTVQQSATKALRTLTGRLLPELGAALGAPFQQGWRRAIEAVSNFVKALTEAVQEGGSLYPLMVRLGVIARIVGEAFGWLVDRATEMISGLQTEIGGGLAEAAADALEWGVNIVASLAEGLTQGAVWFLTQAMNFIGGLLTGWLGPGSPPRVAPDIDKWGAQAFTEYLKGFTEADFGVLEAIQAPLKKILGEGAFKQASAALAEAIAEGPTESFFRMLRRSTGMYADEVELLARAEFALAEGINEVTEAEEALEEARDQIGGAISDVDRLTREYNELLRAGTDRGVLEQKLAEINAAEEDLALAEDRASEAETELELAEERLKLLKETSKLQKKLLEQLIAFTQQSEAAAAASGGAGGAGGGGGTITPPTLALPDTSEITGGFGTALEGAIDAVMKRLRERMRQIFQPLRDAWELSIQPALQQATKSAQAFIDRIVDAAWAIATDLIPELENLENTSRDTKDEMDDVGATLEDRLSPATKAWNELNVKLEAFLRVHIMPLLTALRDLVKTGLTVAWQNLANIWRKQILPALREMWSFIKEKFLDIWDQVRQMFKDKLSPALQEFTNKVVEPLRLGFEGIGEAIDGMTKWIETLTELLANADFAGILDLFLGRSPSPLEKGIRGITGAIRELSEVGTPRLASFARGMQPAGAGIIGGMGGGPTPVGSTTYNQMQTQIGPNHFQEPFSALQIEAIVERVVTRRLDRR